MTGSTVGELLSRGMCKDLGKLVVSTGGNGRDYDEVGVTEEISNIGQFLAGLEIFTEFCVHVET